MVAKHKEKRLQSELKRLTRSERTHRLCTRAGMLEIFLKEPTVLTDEDVMEPLTFIFQSEAVQKKLNLLIESRRENARKRTRAKTLDGDKGAIIHHLLSPLYRDKFCKTILTHPRFHDTLYSKSCRQKWWFSP